MMTGASTPSFTSLTSSDAAEGATVGWYLYGITRGGVGDALPEADTGDADAAPLRALECGGLSAVVRPVLLADFSLDAMQERLREPADLEVMVLRHNRVVEAIHARHAILPAKFGMVYADERDILATLRSTCDTLLPRLHHVEGRDEWAVHVFANRAVVRDRAASRDPSLARLRAEHAAARPGRAYFLERQLRGEQEAATRQAIASCAQDAFARLSAVAASAQVDRIPANADVTAEVEILRGAFLVARDDVGRFQLVQDSLADTDHGLRVECTGPWPPYSFAVLDDGGHGR
jgi:hypothetical protein